MTDDITSIPLVRALKKKDESLAYRVGVIRKEVSAWLPHVTQFFPHYPSHGLDHSDRIVAQLSRLLIEADKRKPAVDLSAAEIYCLIAAAYLHDIGMVVPFAEAQELQTTQEWKDFVAESGPGHRLHEDYVELRNAAAGADDHSRHFMADRALRIIIADFIRRTHHQRVTSTLQLHPFLKQWVTDRDPVAFRTIADICIGHGLRSGELTNPDRFPEERDVLGGKVNVRFLARLLRIGDLLDMSSRRADPMSLRTLGPLRRDAQPHWQQYSSKCHENITPHTIEYRFECNDQNTHRVLRDWFEWLEDEVRETILEQQHAARHAAWKGPRCCVSSRAEPDDRSETRRPTITISPASGANYVFHDWRLELDHDLILDRFIYAYNDRSTFVRELIQNALDATRCRMYEDFKNAGLGEPPKSPTQFPPPFRERYPIHLSLKTESVSVAPDREAEERLVFSIEDYGTGMDEDKIRRYFLQIGRSYYTSDEFRRRHEFAPTSRFGVGFLSVFAVSSDVTVDTAAGADPADAIRLQLRGPRQYLLTERTPAFPDRKARRHGTRIRLVLDEWPTKQSLTDLVRELCVATEVPIISSENGAEMRHVPSRLRDGEILAQGKADPSAQFVLRAFPVDVQAVEGQIAVTAYHDELGDGWCDCWPDKNGLDGRRLDVLPELEQWFAFHGIAQGMPDRSFPSQWTLRCDVRSPVASVSLTRGSGSRHAAVGSRERGDVDQVAMTAAQRVAEAEVERHLAGSKRCSQPDGIYYVGKVLSKAPVSDEWRDAFPATIPTWRNGRRIDISLAELLAADEFILAGWWRGIWPSFREANSLRRHPRGVPTTSMVIALADVPQFAAYPLIAKMKSMSVADLQRYDDLHLLNLIPGDAGLEQPDGNTQVWLLDQEFYDNVAILRWHLGIDSSNHFAFSSKGHPMTEWLCRVREAVETTELHYREAATALWSAPCHYITTKLHDILASWREDPTLPDVLRPPAELAEKPSIGVIESSRTIDNSAFASMRESTEATEDPAG